MKALVTGSEGFVAGRMIPALEAQGYDQITTIDIHDPIRPVDARDFFRRSTEQFDLVVHLAAIVGGRAMIEGNPLAVAVDLAIDAELFQWAVRTQQPHILYFSSSAAYPTRLQERDGARRLLTEDDIDLDDIRSPDLSYGWAKLTGEMQAREARKHGVKVMVARPFSGTGPTQSLDYPVPAIIDRAVRREDPLTVWSDTVRDIIAIDDVIEIALHAVRAGVQEPFNCGTGIRTSFTTIARMAAKAVGYDPEIVVLHDKPAGVAHRVADTAFQRSICAHPLTSLDAIIAEMVTDRRAFLTNAATLSGAIRSNVGRRA